MNGVHTVNRAYGGDRFTLYAGVMRFCMDHHSGEWSKLYGVGSRIHAMFTNLPDSLWSMRGEENEAARMVYRHLRRNYPWRTS